jgi:hypothetical protein
MRRVVTGEELAQLYNPDPFAMPRWRAPVYRTPLGIILAAKLARLLAWMIRMIARHPLAASVLAAGRGDVGQARLGHLVALVLALVGMLGPAAIVLAGSFTRVGRPTGPGEVGGPWFLRRRWARVMTIAGVAPW